MAITADAMGLGFLDYDHDAGCAFMLRDRAEPGVPRATCGAPRRPGSPYCEQHHALCHLRLGGRGAARRLREMEALASAAGGRAARPRPAPSPQELRRLERAKRRFL